MQGRVKTYAPPFMMLGVNLENTTSSDFRITADRTLPRLRRRRIRIGAADRRDHRLRSERRRRALSPARLDAAVRRALRGRRQRDVQPHRRRRGDCALRTDDRARLGLNVGVNLGARQRPARRRVCRPLDRVDRGRRPWLSRAARQEDRAQPSCGDSIRRTARSCPQADGSRRCELSRVFNGPDVDGRWRDVRLREPS